MHIVLFIILYISSTKSVLDFFAISLLIYYYLQLSELQSIFSLEFYSQLHRKHQLTKEGAKYYLANFAIRIDVAPYHCHRPCSPTPALAEQLIFRFLFSNHKTNSSAEGDTRNMFSR